MFHKTIKQSSRVRMAEVREHSAARRRRCWSTGRTRWRRLSKLAPPPRTGFSTKVSAARARYTDGVWGRDWCTHPPAQDIRAGGQPAQRQGVTLPAVSPQHLLPCQAAAEQRGSNLTQKLMSKQTYSFCTHKIMQQCNASNFNKKIDLLNMY